MELKYFKLIYLMAKIIIAGAGGAPSEGVIYSLKERKGDEIIGMGSFPYDLALSKASKRFLVPYAYEANYEEKLISLLKKEKPNQQGLNSLRGF